MQGAIKPDATISDVVGSLVNAEEYIRKVLDFLHRAKDASVRVRIGTTGKGPYPCYRICKSGPDGAEIVIAAYNDNGTPFATSQRAECWSTQSMSLTEVAQLLGAVRTQKRSGI
jgi:hypothetical protein